MTPKTRICRIFFCVFLLFITTCQAKILNGIDVLRASGFANLQGKRIGLITNATGIARDGTSTIDLLHENPGVQLITLFGPEHGIRGEAAAGASVEDSRDPGTGLPIHSLYSGESRKPAPETLAGLDALVFDIQDIGTRFYTYISTMGLCMEAAASAGIPEFIVLDRPNPLGGERIAGPLPVGSRSFIAHHNIPVVHGMTVGELAKLFQAENKIPIQLTVIKVEGWKRKTTFDKTGLPWVNPSPNIRNLEAAQLYPGLGLLEFTNLSVGRGTTTPFHQIGAPYINSEELIAALPGFPGLKISPTRFTPTSSIFAGQLCNGLRFEITNTKKFEPLPLFANLATALVAQNNADLNPQKLQTLLLDPAATFSKEAIPQLLQKWEATADKFRQRRIPYLLYR